MFVSPARADAACAPTTASNGTTGIKYRATWPVVVHQTNNATAIAAVMKACPSSRRRQAAHAITGTATRNVTPTALS